MTRPSVVPDLIDALVAVMADRLPDVTVSDGFAVQQNSGDQLMIGVDDPDSPNPALSATTEQEWAGATATGRNESGEITCAAWAWNGSADAKDARDRVFAVAASVQALLRTDKTLGVPGLLTTGFVSSQLSQGLDGGTAAALLVFRVAFKARI